VEEGREGELRNIDKGDNILGIAKEFKLQPVTSGSCL
jgi:hypothetical protein